MGFFDSFEKWLNEEPEPKKYNERELVEYFREELHGWMHDDEKEHTTNIREMIKKNVKNKIRDVVYWEIFEGINSIVKVDDSTYKIVYKGEIKRMKDSYGADIYRTLRYEIVIYANALAEFAEGKQSSINVFEPTL